MNANPTFSIIVPTFNRADLLYDTINSILQQEFTDFELLVIDDGSTDHTAEIMADYCKRDARIKYTRKENGERGAARNFGIKLALGNYCTFIDSDDIMYPFALSHAFDQLKLRSFPDCYAQAHQIIRKKTGEVILKHKDLKSDTVNEALYAGNLLSCIGVFVKRSVLINLHFEENRNFSGTEDWLLWLQLSARYPIYYSNRICAVMQEHNERSVLYFPEEKLIFRAEYVRSKLQEDKVALAKFGLRRIEKMYAHVLTYAALHLAMSGQKQRAIHHWINAAKIDKAVLYKRITFGILKTILFFKK